MYVKKNYWQFFFQIFGLAVCDNFFFQSVGRVLWQGGAAAAPGAPPGPSCAPQLTRRRHSASIVSRQNYQVLTRHLTASLALLYHPLTISSLIHGILVTLQSGYNILKTVNSPISIILIYVHLNVPIILDS